MDIQQQQQQNQIGHFNSNLALNQDIMSPPTIPSQQRDPTSCISPMSQTPVPFTNKSDTIPVTPITVPSNMYPYQPPLVVSSQLSNDAISNHPIVPSQNSINYRKNAGDNDRSMLTQFQQEAPYVVLSQLSSPHAINMYKRPQTDSSILPKAKSRRHTVSSSFPPPIDTKNLIMASAPRSAAIASSELKPFQISTPPPQQEPQLAILDERRRTYEAMSKEELITRLIAMETEKLKVDDEDEEEPEEEAEEEQVNKDIQCKWNRCSEIFSELSQLITHLNDQHIGSGKNMYFCEWQDCQRHLKPFMKRHKLYNHLRTHTGERPFICEDCGKRFSRLDSLSTHTKTHSNIRPFVCATQGCGKAYYHSRSLRKHEKSH